MLQKSQISFHIGRKRSYSVACIHDKTFQNFNVISFVRSPCKNALKFALELEMKSDFAFLQQRKKIFATLY